MIVHDPRVFVVFNPRWRSVMRRQRPRHGAWVAFVKLKERKTSRDWQLTSWIDRLGSLPNPTYMLAPTVAPACAPSAPSAESQALSVFPPHLPLTSPHHAYATSPSSLTLALLGEPVAFVHISKTSARQQIALMFD